MRPCRSRMPNCRLWNAGSCAEHLDDRARVGAFLQFAEDQHLVRVRAVHRGLARGHALAGHDDGLHAHQELIVAIDAGGRRDHDAAGAAIDGRSRTRWRQAGDGSASRKPRQKHTTHRRASRESGVSLLDSGAALRAYHARACPPQIPCTRQCAVPSITRWPVSKSTSRLPATAASSASSTRSASAGRGTCSR